MYRSAISRCLNTVCALPRLNPNAPPPPDYYSDNLLAVVNHVWEHSADLLGPASGYVEALTQLDGQSRRLLARLIMRTTPVIRVDSLSYTEVHDRDQTLATLAAQQLIEINPDTAAEPLLQRAKVAELKTLFPELVAPKDRKADLLQRILCTTTEAGIRQRCALSFSWVQVDPEGHLQRLQLAYFGDLYRDLTEFVMRDLGVMKYADYALGANARAFAECEELNQYLELASLQQLPVQRRAQALQWLVKHPLIDQVEPANPGLARRRNRLLNAWGRDFERSKLNAHAHACYERSTAHPARERRVRLLHKSAATEPARQLLSAIKSAPWSFEEALFAERFGAGKEAPRQPWTTTVWQTNNAQLPGVERLTGALLTRNTGRAWHTENGLLPSLLGLAFWDIVFAPQQGMFTHPFQAGPRDLFWPDFRARRADLIAARLTECADEAALWSRIMQASETYVGCACRLVHWGVIAHNQGEILAAARRCFRADQLSALFDYMLNDLDQVRSGMPDLFVTYGGAAFELVEVKGPSDSLQPNQRVWLGKLAELGIPCRVIKHKYVPQPETAAKKRTSP